MGTASSILNTLAQGVTGVQTVSVVAVVLLVVVLLITTSQVHAES